MNILDEANKVVNGDRQADYDHPSRNFQRIADLWNGYMKARKPGEFTPVDVGYLMILAKIGRGVFKYKADTYIDIAGYAACNDKIESSELEQNAKSA